MEERMPDKDKPQSERAKRPEGRQKGAGELDDKSLDKVVGGRKAGTVVKDSHDRYANK
jgi:hypothetical protein